MFKGIATFFTVMLFAIEPASAMVQRPASPGAARQVNPVFAYGNHFWRNLHHTLYAFASVDPMAVRARRIRLTADDMAVRDALPEDERAVWAEAVRWYAANLSGRDLLFDEEMVRVGALLSQAGNGSRLGDRDIPDEMRAILERAAPVYRERWWPAHRRANADWPQAVAPLLATHGADIAARLSRFYGTLWPRQSVPVELSYYANSTGAYASLHPTRITLATSDESYRGQAALEMLMHETGHALVGPLRERLNEIAAIETAKPGFNADALRPDLWHEILFYATGKIAADTMPGYEPYADRHGLWGRAFSERDRRAIARHLDPYIAGETTLDEALTALVREIASTQ